MLDPDRVAARYRLMAKHLRGFRLHYAVKALPHPAVLMTVAAWGGGFDVATNAEVDLLRTMRLPMDRCVRLAFPNRAAKSDLSAKFGVPPADADLIVKHVLASGVRFAGFSFHVGGQSALVQPYRTALRETLGLVDHVERTLDVRARVIDIGGGFPVDYREPMPTVGEVGAVVDEILGERRREFAMMAEPGRFLAAARCRRCRSATCWSAR